MSMASTELASLTLAYWNISYCYNRSGDPGYKGKRFSTSKAINLLGESLQRLDPNRPVSRRLFSLSNEIITGDSQATG